MRHRLPPIFSLVPSALLAGLIGCGNFLGPEDFKTARVEGKVRVGSQSVTGGFIEFLPTDGTVGIMRSAPIKLDGTFVVDHAPVGRNAVGIFSGKLPRRLSNDFNALGTPIRRTVTDAPSAPLDIDLLEEEASLQLLRDRASGRTR